MINNNLQHISKGLDELMIDITVKCMLNPENKDFYIGTLTLDKVKSMFVEMNDADLDILTVFWSAFSRAQTKYLEEEQDLIQEYEKSCELDNIACEYAKHGNNSYYGTVCPECGCRFYIPGVACPNCDYVEGV